jgi:hypothetical protein
MKTSLAAAALLCLAAAGAGCAPTVAQDASAAAPSGQAFLRIGEEVRLGGLRVRALRLIEDSRCPAGVQCIHAGTVRIAVRLTQDGTVREAVLRLGEREPLGEGRSLQLLSACPEPPSPGAAPPPETYRFFVAAGESVSWTPPRSGCGPR